VLHHLFPTIDISRISEVNFLLEQTLKEFGKSHLYPKFTFWDLFKGEWKLITRKKGDECYIIQKPKTA
jgi:hypothetical protein